MGVRYSGIFSNIQISDAPLWTERRPAQEQPMCPHARPSWQMCPHCNGANAAARPVAESPELARARVAYRAYGKTTDFLNFRGEPMPEFDALPEKIRQAWVNAAAAVTCDHLPAGGP